jgi:hypothetical protein
LNVAVTTAVWLVEIVPAAAVKVALARPDCTVTEAGTVRAAALLESDTAAPLEPAALESVTVQEEVPAEVRLVGVHDNELTSVEGTTEIDAVEELPFKAAVTTASWLVETEPAVAENVTDAAPDSAITDPGTVRAELLLDREIVVALAGTGLKNTVQVDTCDVFNDPGLQVSPVTCGIRAVTVAPVPVMGRDVPLAEAPSVPVTPIAVLIVVGASVTVTTATTPFCMTLEFSPAMMQA